MTDPKPTETEPASGAYDVKDTMHAPVLYFEGAPNFGCNNSVVNVTLAVSRHLANSKGGINADVVAVAYLRCSIPAAIDLRAALDKALLLGAPPADGGHHN
jgi:hypothetical protein